MSRSTTNEQKQERSPWAPAQEGLQFGLDQARGVYNNRVNQEFFPGQTFADFAPETNQALDATAARATGGSPVVGAAQNNLKGTLEGAFMAQGNPYMENLRSRITADVMPGINATFSRAGRTGSNAHGYGLARGLGDAFAPIEYQNYEAERGRQMQAASMAPSLANYDYQDLAMLRGVGAEREAQEGRQISEDMARYDFDQNRDARALQEYMGTVLPVSQTGGTSTSTTTQSSQQSPWQTALGAGLIGSKPVYWWGANDGHGGGRKCDASLQRSD